MGFEPFLPIIVPLEAELELPDADIGREGGSRRTLHLQLRNGARYLCKGPHLMPEHPFIAVNEWVVAGLARGLDIPIRSPEVLRWEGHLYFGSEILDRKMTGLLSANWGRLRNAPAVAYPLVVLDGWTLNTDRHEQNYLAAVLGNDAGMFLACDHDLALFGADKTAVTLPEHVGQPIDASHVRSSTLAGAIKDEGRLGAAIEAASTLDERYIRGLIAPLPDEWADAAARNAAVTFLLERRAHLQELFTNAVGLFPNLGKEVV